MHKIYFRHLLGLVHKLSMNLIQVAAIEIQILKTNLTSSFFRTAKTIQFSS